MRDPTAYLLRENQLRPSLRVAIQDKHAILPDLVNPVQDICAVYTPAQDYIPHAGDIVRLTDKKDGGAPVQQERHHAVSRHQKRQFLAGTQSGNARRQHLPVNLQGVALPTGLRILH